MSKSRTIGVLLDWPDASSNYQKRLLDGVRGFAAEQQANLTTFAMGRLESPFLWERGRAFLLDYVRPEVLDGLVVLSTAISNFCGVEVLKERLRPLNGLPKVSIGVELEDTPSILVDNTTGMRNLVHHLIGDHHYERIGFVGGPVHNGEAGLRWRTVRDTAGELGVTIPESHCFEGTFLVPSGEAAVEELLDRRGLDLDAIVCANDNMAIGVWEAFWKRSLFVPADIAVTGFDDLEPGSVLELPFTTVRQRLFDQGYAAAELLWEELEGNSPVDGKRVRVLPTELVVRQSCGCETADGDSSRNRPTAGGDIHGGDGFAPRNRDRMRDALSRFRKLGEGDVLTRPWNKVLLEAIQQEVKQSDALSLYVVVRDELDRVDIPDHFRPVLNEALARMRRMVDEV